MCLLMTCNYCFCLIIYLSIVWCAVIANSAAAVGGILFFVTYIPYAFLQPRYDQLSWPVKMMCCLVFNLGMSLGCQVIGMFEGTGMCSSCTPTIFIGNVAYNNMVYYQSCVRCVWIISKDNDDIDNDLMMT